MSNGVACPRCGAFLNRRKDCPQCGPVPAPGLKGFRQTSSFVLGCAWIGALTVGLVIAFARAVPGVNDAVEEVMRWLWGVVGE